MTHHFVPQPFAVACTWSQQRQRSSRRYCPTRTEQRRSHVSRQTSSSSQDLGARPTFEAQASCPPRFRRPRFLADPHATPQSSCASKSAASRAQRTFLLCDNHHNRERPVHAAQTVLTNEEVSFHFKSAASNCTSTPNNTNIHQRQHPIDTPCIPTCNTYTPPAPIHPSCYTPPVHFPPYTARTPHAPCAPFPPRPPHTYPPHRLSSPTPPISPNIHCTPLPSRLPTPTPLRAPPFRPILPRRLPPPPRPPTPPTKRSECAF